MKHKTADLEGPLLDAAVALAEGLRWEIKPAAMGWVGPGPIPKWCFAHIAGNGFLHHFNPSASWDFGGRIIERERISLKGCEGGGWSCYFDHPTERDATAGGPTPLIAAMRAYVASKFGEEIDMPD